MTFIKKFSVFCIKLSTFSILIFLTLDNVEVQDWVQQQHTNVELVI